MGATISKYSESSANSMPEKKYISSTVIPVEVFIIFVVYNQQSFTVNDLKNLFFTSHKIDLSFTRMQQIIKDLVAAGKLKVHQAPNKQNHIVNYYSFKTIQ